MAPRFSLVISVRDGGQPFGKSLAAVAASVFSDWELIVVDDGSRDGSAEVGAHYGARVLKAQPVAGEPAARNAGAQASSGEYLFFLGADCQIHRDGLQRAARLLASQPRIDALIGSSDDSPAVEGFIGRYGRLREHWVHQHAADEADTFWADCGAIRRRTFLKLGGFDAACHGQVAADLDLGYRLRAAGGRICVAKGVLVKRQLALGLKELLRRDLQRGACRGFFLMRHRRMYRDLDSDLPHRLNVAACLALMISAVLAPFDGRGVLLMALMGGLLVAANLRFYQFLEERAGWRSALAALPLHWLGLLTPVAGFTWGIGRHLRARIPLRRDRRLDAEQPSADQENGGS